MGPPGGGSLPRMPHAALLLALALTLALGAAAYTRNAVWRGDLSLWSDAAAKSPGRPSSLNNLGMAYYDRGRLDEALAVFTRLMERQPRFGLAPMGVANVLGRRGDHAAAAGLLERARALLPGYWAIHYNLGNEYLLLDRLDEAEASYRRALAINAHMAPVYHNLGVLLVRRGRLGEALAALERALDLDPGDAGMRRNRDTAAALVKQTGKGGK